MWQRRRYVAIWLLIGWAVFWLSSVIQPCCQNAAADDGTHWVAVGIPGDATKTDMPCASVAQGDESCPSVPVAKAAPSDPGSTVTYRAELQFFSAEVASIARAPDPAGARIGYITTDFPSSGARLYLRFQRLLI